MAANFAPKSSPEGTVPLLLAKSPMRLSMLPVGGHHCAVLCASATLPPQPSRNTRRWYVASVERSSVGIEHDCQSQASVQLPNDTHTARCTQFHQWEHLRGVVKTYIVLLADSIEGPRTCQPCRAKAAPIGHYATGPLAVDAAYSGYCILLSGRPRALIADADSD